MMIVHFDFESQRNDPAFSPAGGVPVDIPLVQYQAATTERDILVLAQPIAAAKNSDVGAALTTQIQAIDAAAVTVTPAPVDQATTDAIIAQRQRYVAAYTKTPGLTWAQFLLTDPGLG